MTDEQRRPIADVLDELIRVIEAVRGDRDVIRVSGLIGNSEDVGIVGIDGLQENLRRAVSQLRSVANRMISDEVLASQPSPAATVETTMEHIAQEFYNRMGPHEMVSREEARNMLRAIEPPAHLSAATDYANGLKSLSGLVTLTPEQSDFLHDAAEEFERITAAPQRSPKPPKETAP
ncbi:hypothetical protein [Bradyrhizobium sp. 150]|uniref:hypothetical protein n=1 Tax=Bradyrhizobium sp. 150 TaxID=2782625 RepID=UPI001FFC1F56|nr:hypothetical protein [Bradyrhizobium sp. 150]MCK1670343.1 hypothetical protein [Bradyrhizobium sp. 150]